MLIVETTAKIIRKVDSRVSVLSLRPGYLGIALFNVSQYSPGVPMRFLCFLLLGLGVVGIACTPPNADTPLPPSTTVTSLLGEALEPPALAPERAAQLEANLAEARATYDAAPSNADNIIWLGRRTAYLWRYPEAVSIFSEGIDQFSDDARLYRHRGHRHITVRQLDNAIADFAQAARLIEGTEDQIEPDGAPNAAGIPVSTLHTNIWYHLALAHYLKGDFESAAPIYAKGLAASENDDMRVAMTDWYYMTLRRLGRDAEASALLEPIHADMELLENHVYLRRLLMYKGELEPDALLRSEESGTEDLDYATQGYGVGNWYLYNGNTEQAKAIFERVLAGSYWAAFGYIAAEAELARMDAE